MARQNYTPPSDHRRNSAERYPAKPVPGTIHADGYPLSIGDDFLFGTDDVDPNNGNAPVHIGGFPDISRDVADAFITSRGLHPYTKGRDEPAWGAGFTLVRDRAGEPHLLVGPEASPQLIHLATLPDRVRQGMGDLGGLWLAGVPFEAPQSAPVGGLPPITREEVRDIAHDVAREVLAQVRLETQGR